MRERVTTSNMHEGVDICIGGLVYMTKDEGVTRGCDSMPRVMV